MMGLHPPECVAAWGIAFGTRGGGGLHGDVQVHASWHHVHGLNVTPRPSNMAATAPEGVYPCATAVGARACGGAGLCMVPRWCTCGV